MKPALVIALVLIGSGIGAVVGMEHLQEPGEPTAGTAQEIVAAPTSGTIHAPGDAQPTTASPSDARNTTASPSEARKTDSELEAARARITELEEKVRDLRIALDAAESARIEREREFLRFTQGISQLGALAGGVAPTFATQVPAAEQAAIPVLGSAASASSAASQATDPAHGAAGSSNDATGAAIVEPSAVPEMPPIVDVSRSRAIYLNLRALLAAEQVQGIDLLESGNLQSGFVGPIVMRELDAYGHPIGSLVADRLRLEASRAARMVTIVLEQGCERRDATSVPFAGGPADPNGRGGQRRIVLSDCDPRPWIESMPELFPAVAKDETLDDGRTDLPKLRATLNTLLHSEAGASVESAARPHSAGDWYRMQGIGGVQGAVLRDVALDQFDRDGRLLRRLFADRMSFLREAHGLQILLQDGTQVRGEEKAPFLEGRYRIFLPRADAAAWAKEGVPGLEPKDVIAPAPAPNPAPSDPAAHEPTTKDAVPTAPKQTGAPDPAAPPAPAPVEPHKG